jgi:hypothetical protein
MIALARTATFIALAALSACASSAKSADDVRKGVADAATLPLRDVGLIRPEVPTPLKGLNYPYRAERLHLGCAEVTYQIGQIDAAIGVESYQPGAETSLISKGTDSAGNLVIGSAVDAAADVVPFRSWVRRASGANKAEKEVAQALEMGQSRRAFLRGYGAALGCTSVIPAPPPSDAKQFDSATPPPQARDLPPARPR